jgi:hypothetical protein
VAEGFWAMRNIFKNFRYNTCREREREYIILVPRFREYPAAGWFKRRMAQMRINILIVLLAAMAVGCAARMAVVPDEGSQTGQSVSFGNAPDDQHRLWGEYLWFIDKHHDRIEVVPKRQARLHLNALKFLESYCTDCVKITKMKNNGDGTIDVTVRITHPFPDNPEYTGFDVKGILMLNGSHDIDWGSYDIYPFYEAFHISWKEAGDAEILNPDGYTPRWNPSWDSGSSLPVYNYWPGKHSNGIPSANLNAFKNFYTDEQRHMFRVTGKVERTYHIWLPPGPLVVGYAVEACWEPPINTPVTDPINDFPYSANQPEPYYAKLVVNNDQIITGDCCGDYNCSTVQYELSQWYGAKPQFSGYMPGGACPGSTPSLIDCPNDPDPTDDLYFMGSNLQISMCGNGKHRGIAVLYREHYEHIDRVLDWLVYVPFDYEIEM